MYKSKYTKILEGFSRNFFKMEVGMNQQEKNEKLEELKSVIYKANSEKVISTEEFVLLTSQLVECTKCNQFNEDLCSKCEEKHQPILDKILESEVI